MITEELIKAFYNGETLEYTIRKDDPVWRRVDSITNFRFKDLVDYNFRLAPQEQRDFITASDWLAAGSRITRKGWPKNKFIIQERVKGSSIHYGELMLQAYFEDNFHSAEKGPFLVNDADIKAKDWILYRGNYAKST